jgi:hypothetical protein
MEKVFLNIPLPFSKAVYSLARRTLFGHKDYHFFDKAFNKAAQCYSGGDYLEFGVYRGSSFVTSYQLAQKYRLHGMRFFAFDSFCGLPEGEGEIWVPGMYSCSRQRFTSIINKAGVDLNKVVIVEGLYSDTLKPATKGGNSLRNAAVIHIDCDLYSSTLAALAFVEDIIRLGTIIIFDDWYCFSGDPNYGEKKAFLEWSSRDCFEELYSSEQAKAFYYIRPVSLL